MQALLIIDMQMIMQQRIDAGRDTVNAEAGRHVGRLARAFRRAGRPVVHIRHRTDDPTSPLRPAASGYPAMPQADAEGDEALFVKRTSSAFASTQLEAHLRQAGVTGLVVAGAVAGFCVNSTVRAGADLGFAMTVAADATIGFDVPDAGWSARTVFDVTMAQLAADFAIISDTDTIAAAMAGYA